MDVSGWAVEQRMRLPDWCFGNRQLIGAEAFVPGAAPGTYAFAISDVALPDPVCIWGAYFWSNADALSHITFRVGLSNTVPINEAEMDLTAEIFPHIGSPATGPNKLRFSASFTVVLPLRIRKGMVTGGKKVVLAFFSSVGNVFGTVVLEVSGLPTDMAGWLAHNKV